MSVVCANGTDSEWHPSHPRQIQGSLEHLEPLHFPNAWANIFEVKEWWYCVLGFRPFLGVDRSSTWKNKVDLFVWHLDFTHVASKCVWLLSEICALPHLLTRFLSADTA